MSSSEDYHSLAHSKWDCKYHLVFIPKGREKKLYGQIRHRLGGIFHALAAQKDCKILEGHLMADHVHMLVEIPLKYAVSSVVGFLKGKSAIASARELGGKERNSRANTSGPEATPCPPLGTTSRRSGSTSAHKKLMKLHRQVAHFN